MDSKQTISFKCQLENLKKVRDFVRSELEKCEFSAIDKNQIVLAIDEVCTNLIVHSNLNDKNKEITLSLNLITTPKGLSIEFVENGIPFDYDHYEEPDIHNLKENRIKGKLGLVLVRRIMDKIEYLQVENHNVCRLYKSLA